MVLKKNIKYLQLGLIAVILTFAIVFLRKQGKISRQKVLVNGGEEEGKGGDSSLMTAGSLRARRHRECMKKLQAH